MLQDILQTVLTSQAPQAASRRTGVDSGLAAQLMPMAASMITEALSRNARDASGAQAIERALDRHDGAVLNTADRVDEDDKVADGQAILSHVFGANRQAAEAALGKQGGIDSSQAGALLAMAAPLVMGALGKAKRDQGLDLSSLTRMLDDEGSRARQQMPSGLQLGALTSILDRDGDGNLNNEARGLLGSVIKGFLGGRRR